MVKHRALTTADALDQYSADVAINGSFFVPFKDLHLMDYYPHSGDWVEPLGATKSGGQWYGLLNIKWPVFVVYSDGRLAIETSADKLLELSLSTPFVVQFMLSGKSLLVTDGLPIHDTDQRLYPVSAVGLNKNRDILWFVVVDGKQPFYSDGILLFALAKYMVALGVYQGLQLDGGGSATLAWKNAMGNPELLSRPSHTRIPNRQRPVANHILVTITPAD